MSRPPRRPPHLEPAVPAARAGGPRDAEPLEAQLLRARVAGRHDRLSPVEVVTSMRRLAFGDRDPALGLRGAPPGVGALRAAAHEIWGWDPGSSAVEIDPQCTVASAERAFARVADVSTRGGRLALAVARPASLLPLVAHVGRLARACGATVRSALEARPLPEAGRAGTRLWWLDDVGVLTDGRALLADAGPETAAEWLFEIGRVDLVVADRVFAAAALDAEIEVVAPADLDAVILGHAAMSGRPITVVPMQCHRPAPAYRPLQDLATRTIRSS